MKEEDSWFSEDLGNKVVDAYPILTVTAGFIGRISFLQSHDWFDKLDGQKFSQDKCWRQHLGLVV